MKNARDWLLSQSKWSMEEIQLDAFKAGMDHAATIACDQQKYFTREASIQCLVIHDAIINASKAMTELPQPK